MGPKKGRRNVRKVEVPKHTPIEFELGDAAADIQRRGKEREQRERGRKRHRHNRGRTERRIAGEGEPLRRVETPQSTEEGVVED